jgi:hypothetical protein
MPTLTPTSQEVMSENLTACVTIVPAGAGGGPTDTTFISLTFIKGIFGLRSSGGIVLPITITQNANGCSTIVWTSITDAITWIAFGFGT